MSPSFFPKPEAQSRAKAQPYIGRFAPSPSGPLHFGSLVAALGSFLQAKKHEGQWLLRIEDIDPPREQVGATSSILTCLEKHGLLWDGQPLYQSQQSAVYEKALSWLHEHKQTYYCRCTRKQRECLAKNQACLCRPLALGETEASTRFINSHPATGFSDKLLKNIVFDACQGSEDFVVKRKDGLYAYQLAVVVDDCLQGVTEVVRGADLLQATAFQLSLYKAFGHCPPSYLHLPLVLGQTGQKLSKQNHAPAVDNHHPSRNILHALGFLGLSVPAAISKAPVDELLLWASLQWNVKSLEAKTEGIDNRIGRSDRI